MRPSTEEQAALSLTTHSFVPGQGYVDHGRPPPYPTEPRQSVLLCDPPADTVDGSEHVLAVPGDLGEMPFRWVAAERAWKSPGGNRLAWPATYLAANGWRWLRAV